MQTEKLYRVYVLQNPDGRFYIGLSEDIANRLDQHNAGLSKWTAKFRPWILAWAGDPMPLSQARKLENKLKRAKGGDQFYSMTSLCRRENGS